MSDEDEKIGFTDEDLAYLAELAKVKEEDIIAITKILEFLDKTIKDNPVESGKALEEMLRRNVK